MIMKVRKRNGEIVPVDFNKITHRLTKIVDENNLQVDPIKVAQRVCNSIYDGVHTRELDELSSEISISLCTDHPDYATLAGHVCVSNLHKNTSDTFSKCVDDLYEHSLVSKRTFDVVMSHEARINSEIDNHKDYSFDYFGMKTMMKSYLFKVKGNIVERPQYMLMRVAIGIHDDDLEKVFETYRLMSDKYFIHATPTLFNAGTSFPQLSSCYLLELEDDSIHGIYDTLKECASISKWAGGIGLHIHKLRATGSGIRNATGACTGIVPSLRVFNATSRYVNQGGKRPGSIAIYLGLEHADIMSFLELKKNHGDEEQRCRDLFYGLWVSDLFMKRVESDSTWSLFCPSTLPTPLEDVYGDEYERLYLEYESKGLYVNQVKARTIWFAICNAQIETGTPYILYKDAVNTKSNQKNVGTIKSSNLCCEIVEYTSKDETAVCNLASVSLPMFVNKDKTFDHERLHSVVKVICKNLNKVIEVNMYPVEKARRSNMRHRPIGIGVQGLADMYIRSGFPFDSVEASALNIDVFETIYHAALDASIECAIQSGAYETFQGSPMSKGILQFDMWPTKATSSRYDWNAMKARVMKQGVRNSLMIAPMPTASTSQILGNNECIEPYTSNVYLRRTSAGEFVVVNKHLIYDLIQLGIWNKSVKDTIILNEGSIQNVNGIPDHIKNLYKTAWEISQKTLIDQAADRGRFVCQSQSLNLFLQRPTIKALSSMHFYSWNKGLKTGIYYLRSLPSAKPIQFSIAPSQECVSCSA